MKKYTLYIFALVIFASSCEDPIEVDVASSDPQISVDAFITNKDEIQTISIKETRPIFQQTSGNTIEDATVVVRNETSGVSMSFDHVGEGKYQYDPIANGSIGEIGDNYTLDISRSGANYSSTSVLNPVPVIDSIGQEFRDDQLFGGDGIYCQFYARDLPGPGNTYWIKTFKNDTFLNREFEINIAYDACFPSGTQLDDIIFITPIRELVNEINDDGLLVPYESGEKIRIEIHSLTRSTFEFMEVMRDQLINGQNGIFAEPVANARGNIVNESGDEEILGIFNVAAVSVSESIIE